MFGLLEDLSLDSCSKILSVCSASKDGRVIVRDILETRGSDGKLLITEHIVMALQFIDDWDTTHLRICWHVHKQVLGSF